MVAPRLPNAVLAHHFVLGVFAHLFSDFGGLLKKLLFLRRTLLLRLQGYPSVGMLASGLANAVLAQHFVLGVFAHLFFQFRWPTKEPFVLRTDAVFAAPGLPKMCWCRNVAAGLANAVLVQHSVLGAFAQLFTHFSGLLKKLLFLGRTMPLRRWASKPVLV